MKQIYPRCFLCLVLALLCLAFVSCGHEHAFEGWVMTKAPTCTEAGERVGTCACGERATETVRAKGHGATGEHVSRAPTCTEEGVLVTVCTVCEATVGQTAIPMSAHTEATVTVREPTCKQAGTERAYCTVCETQLSSRFLPMRQHKDLAYTYNGDTTATSDGTATAVCPHCDYTDTKTVEGSAEMFASAFSGLTVSILGDSISTYEGYSNGMAADTTNSTIRQNAVWSYGPAHPEYGVTRAEHTWWQRTADTLGATLLVNNSWSGDKITSRALTRCVQLHDNTGDNAGECPDLIFIYLGTNDFSAVGASVGSIEHLSMDDIAAKANSESYTPASVAEGYAVMLYRIQKAYPTAEIYCLTVLEKPGVNVSALTAFNDGMMAVARRFEGVYVADIFRDSGIHDGEAFDYYVPNNRLHPGYEGMRVISEVVLKCVLENSRYVDFDIHSLIK